MVCSHACRGPAAALLLGTRDWTGPAGGSSAQDRQSWDNTHQLAAAVLLFEFHSSEPSGLSLNNDGPDTHHRLLQPDREIRHVTSCGPGAPSPLVLCSRHRIAPLWACFLPGPASWPGWCTSTSGIEQKTWSGFWVELIKTALRKVLH